MRGFVLDQYELNPSKFDRFHVFFSFCLKVFKHVEIITRISGFLKLEGSSWEPTFDPKRLQERSKDDFEEHRARRGEKKGNKNDKKMSKS